MLLRRLVGYLIRLLIPFDAHMDRHPVDLHCRSVFYQLLSPNDDTSRQLLPWAGARMLQQFDNCLEVCPDLYPCLGWVCFPSAGPTSHSFVLQCYL